MISRLQTFVLCVKLRIKSAISLMRVQVTGLKNKVEDIVNQDRIEKPGSNRKPRSEKLSTIRNG
ncbi:hypothetical protein [Methanosarcina horonobensis]|uniref:hypothetical protein n=1 Tax=Methanosarcina horonobensis TaxID=418008 RepID=UPI00064E5C11|nr:hypothetical protein [Methanosarcina horonobensis]